MAKYKFYARAGDHYGATVHETDAEEFKDDVSEEELNRNAEEHMWNTVEPNYWWEKVDD